MVFTPDGIRAWQFLSSTHALPLVSGPPGLWLQPWSPDLRDILRGMAMERRAFIQEVGQWCALRLQATVKALLFPPPRLDPHEVAKNLWRISLASGSTNTVGRFRSLEMPSVSPAPAFAATGLLDAAWKTGGPPSSRPPK
jgi:hypothetical protein